jgi:hypothetical protein
MIFGILHRQQCTTRSPTLGQLAGERRNSGPDRRTSRTNGRRHAYRLSGPSARQVVAEVWIPGEEKDQIGFPVVVGKLKVAPALEVLYGSGLRDRLAMARLTLARKITAITLIIWKKGVSFDAQHSKQQAA